ncbi:RING-H2 finger protein ATL3-like [Argentina anserina]|uniref:RING-H2 finger protein ATL3-like n=1 Tax=Argentina anserina TaxID=57926 RepID=UPI0021765FCC|nr:RING-H2 finger protein ATL3-like [Potentilla anserina]
MGDTSLGLDDSQAVQLTGKIMMIAVLVLFLVVVFVLCLHLYAKWYWRNVVDDHDPNSSSTRRRRRRFVFVPGQDSGTPTLRRGLDPSVLKSLPLIVFSPEDFKDGLECAVCLSDLVQGEKARLLPKCNHGFHVECIDMWFQSHSTCPLCRNAVAPSPLCPHCDSSVSSELSVQIPSPAETLASGFSSESPNFPTNVLFWGNQTRVSSGPGSGLEEGTSAEGPCPSSYSETRRPEGMLVIDIPSENPMASLASPSPSGNSRFGGAEEDLKSPVPTRLRSLKRLLSRDRKISPCSPSPSSAVDVEAGRAQS